MSWFDFTTKGSGDIDLPNIFPIPILQKDFVSIDLQAIYTRILTDAIERTQGVPKEAQNLLWDNCLGSEKQDGLVTLLAKAMAKKSELYLVYNPGLKIIRPADQKEETQIKADYVKSGESKIGVYITFKNFTRTDMVTFYSILEFCTIGGLWKQANLSKALQIKIKALRASVSLAESSDAKAQIKKIADALAEGKDVGIDAEDIIELMKPDMSTHTSMMEFISQKKSFYLGMPATYITGEASAGLGDSGKGDTKATERGLKAYYFSIAKPVVEGIFKVTTTFKSEDSDGLAVALETLKTMDITSDEYLGKDNKTLIVNKAFGLDANEVGDEPEEITAPPPEVLPPPPKA